MSIEKLMERDIEPLYLGPGYTLSINYKRYDENNKLIINEIIEKEEMTEELIADKAIIFRLENEFCLEKGIGVVLGKKKG